MDFLEGVHLSDVDFSEEKNRMHHLNDFIYVTEGETSFFVEGEVFHLTEGDILYVPAGSYHREEPSKKSAKKYVLQLSNSVFPAFLQTKADQISFMKVSDNAKFYERWKKYLTSYSEQESKTLLACEGIKLLILLPINKIESPVSTKLAEILDYIKSDLHHNLTLDTISEHFHFSKSYVCTEFKRAFQMPLIQYVRLKKVIACHKEILNGKKKNETAEKFGFKDYSTFYRAYTKFIKSSTTG